MRMRPVWVAAGFASALLLALAQDGEAPPAIQQGGIGNFASHMPSQLPSGGIAQGSLIRILGWRLGPAAPGKVVIRIRRGESHVETTAMAVSEEEIEARVPADAPVGSAMLQVVKNGHASLEWPVTIVESSFGAFSRNGQGWGPGEIVNAGGTPNSETQSARPGATATLAGTGLGMRMPPREVRVLVAGKPAKAVSVDSGKATRPGVDTIAFELPADTPEGCHVPVQVSSAPGLYSNAVTLAVSRGGGPCADKTGWSTGATRQTVRLGTVMLVQADLEIGATPKDIARYPVDVGLASFAEIQSGDSVNPLFLFPPMDTCTAYSGTAGLRSITSPLTALEALPGKPLDAGPNITVTGQGGQRLLPGGGPLPKNYRAVIGGHAPVPGMRPLPQFLTPGDYRVSGPGGAGMGSFQASVRVGQPLLWRNREQLGEVDRTQGATVTWRSSANSAMILIVAMNADSRDGALGVGACLAQASAGSFTIPPYALANIPRSPEHPRGFPLNLILLLELPETPATAGRIEGVDRILTFATSISGRTVQFK